MIKDNYLNPLNHMFEQTETTETVSYNILDSCKTLFVRSFEDELSRLPTDEVIILMPWLVKVCSTVKLHTLFSKDSLVRTTEEIFTAPVVRDFCICLADRFYIELGSEEGHLDNLLIILSNVCHINEGDSCLVPKRIIATLQTLSKNKENIRDLLAGNSWLVVYVMLFITYRMILKSAITLHPKLVPSSKTPPKQAQ